MTNGMINRKYKDSLFRMIFREKEELLSLYNAMNGTEYKDPEMLEVNTIEDVLSDLKREKQKGESKARSR